MSMSPSSSMAAFCRPPATWCSRGTPDGKFFAYDATTGKRLWDYDTHGIILAAPAAVEANGKEVILVPTGDGTGGLTVKYKSELASTPRTITAPSRLVAFALGGTATIPDHPPKTLLQPARPPQDAALAKKGEAVYGERECGNCHSHDMNLGGAGYIPDLRNVREGTLAALPQILRQGVLSPAGMPQFKDISDEDIAALQAFIINTAWDAYDAQQSGKQPVGDRAQP